MSGVNARDRVDDNAQAVDARRDWTGAPIAYGLLAVAEAVLDLAAAVRASAPPRKGPVLPVTRRAAPADVCQCSHPRAMHHDDAGADCRAARCQCQGFTAVSGD